MFFEDNSKVRHTVVQEGGLEMGVSQASGREEGRYFQCAHCTGPTCFY